MFCHLKIKGEKIIQRDFSNTAGLGIESFFFNLIEKGKISYNVKALEESSLE